MGFKYYKHLLVLHFFNDVKSFTISILFIVFIVAGMVGSVQAQKTGKLDESVQELFRGETVYAQEKNEIQLTSIPATWKKDGKRTFNFPLQLEYGISNRLQFELALPFIVTHRLTNENFSGAGNAELGFLYNLYNNKAFAMSLALEMELPTAKKTKENIEREIEWEPSLIVAKQLGKTQIHTSLAAGISKNEIGFVYNLATVYAVKDWRATLELTDVLPGNKIYVTPGLVWRGIEDFEFGLAISKEANRYNAEWICHLMITYEFLVKKP